jgi:hypothetical protein
MLELRRERRSGRHTAHQATRSFQQGTPDAAEAERPLKLLDEYKLAKQLYDDAFHELHVTLPTLKKHGKP